MRLRIISLATILIVFASAGLVHAESTLYMSHNRQLQMPSVSPGYGSYGGGYGSSMGRMPSYGGYGYGGQGMMPRSSSFGSARQQSGYSQQSGFREGYGSSYGNRASVVREKRKGESDQKKRKQRDERMQRAKDQKRLERHKSKRDVSAQRRGAKKRNNKHPLSRGRGLG